MNLYPISMFSHLGYPKDIPNNLKKNQFEFGISMAPGYHRSNFFWKYIPEISLRYPRVYQNAKVVQGVAGFPGGYCDEHQAHHDAAASLSDGARPGWYCELRQWYSDTPRSPAKERLCQTRIANVRAAVPWLVAAVVMEGLRAEGRDMPPLRSGGWCCWQPRTCSLFCDIRGRGCCCPFQWPPMCWPRGWYARENRVSSMHFFNHLGLSLWRTGEAFADDCERSVTGSQLVTQSGHLPVRKKFIHSTFRLLQSAPSRQQTIQL